MPQISARPAWQKIDPLFIVALECPCQSVCQVNREADSAGFEPRRSSAFFTPLPPALPFNCNHLPGSHMQKFGFTRQTCILRPDCQEPCFLLLFFPSCVPCHGPGGKFAGHTAKFSIPTGVQAITTSQQTVPHLCIRSRHGLPKAPRTIQLALHLCTKRSTAPRPQCRCPASRIGSTTTSLLPKALLCTPPPIQETVPMRPNYSRTASPNQCSDLYRTQNSELVLMCDRLWVPRLSNLSIRV